MIQQKGLYAALFITPKMNDYRKSGIHNACQAHQPTTRASVDAVLAETTRRSKLARIKRYRPKTPHADCRRGRIQALGVRIAMVKLQSRMLHQSRRA